MAKKRTILIVEDNEINREMLCSLLDDKFEILEAQDGLDGLQILQKNYERLSLILLDVYMPRCDGFEFLRRKRQDKRFESIPVIVTTASNSPEDEIECLQLGANDFVLKPYNYDVILNRISNTIHLRETASIVNQLTWDNLTGLYSSEFFYRRANELLSDSASTGHDMVCCEVVNLKNLNDRYGKQACDQMLKELADRLQSTLPSLETGGRIDSETLAFLVRHQQQQEWVSALSDQTKGLLATNVQLKIGIVANANATMAASLACSRALIAIEQIKDSFGVDVAWYNDELHRKQIREHIILESMEDALKEHQFAVYYQPKHDIRTGSIGGAEALVRWTHPELGFVRPDHFIPLFERNGFITQLDLYVIEMACREIQRCKEQGLPVIPVSVNVSRLDFDLPDLPQTIRDIADRYAIEHELLHIELTETAYTDNPSRVVDALEELRGMGFRIELDDFGSGYSSLASLNALPLDVMKLDMSIIRQAHSLNDYRIVHSAIQIAQFLGLETVAEGVETADETSRLKELGCDMIQGYYFAKPLEQQEFENYVNQRRERMTLKELYAVVGGNYDEALSRMRSEAFVGKIIVRFLDDSSCPDLLAAWEAKDEQAAFKAAHTAKGVCANLSLTHLYDITNEICEALREGNESLRQQTDVDSLIRRLNHDYSETVDAIRLYQSTQEA